MTDKARIKIAAVVTALFLAAVSLAGIATRADTPQAAATPVPAAALQQVPAAGTTIAAADHEDGEDREDDHDE